MIDVWDILTEILTDCGLIESDKAQTGCFCFHIVPLIADGSYMGLKHINIWCKGRLIFKIYSKGYDKKHNEIIIYDYPSGDFTNLNLCDDDCIERIREIIVQYDK